MRDRSRVTTAIPSPDQPAGQDSGLTETSGCDRPASVARNGEPAPAPLGVGSDDRPADERRDLVAALSLPGLADIPFDPFPARTMPRDADLY